MKDINQQRKDFGAALKKIAESVPGSVENWDTDSVTFSENGSGFDVPGHIAVVKHDGKHYMVEVTGPFVFDEDEEMWIHEIMAE